MALQTTISNACATMQAGLETLGQPSSAVESPCKLVIEKSLDKIKTGAAKVALMWDGGSTPSPKDADSVIDALQQDVLNYCALCCQLMGMAGPTLQEDLKQQASTIIDTCTSLLKPLENLKELKDYTMKHHVGRVWAACDAAKKLGHDNKAAYFRHLAHHLTVLNDTNREVSELLDVKQDSTGSKAGGAVDEPSCSASDEDEAEDEDEADLMGFEADALSEEERQVATAVQALMQVTVKVIKHLGRLLVSGPSVCLGDSTEQWENVLFHCKGVRRAVEDLGASLYSPQDTAELSSSSSSLHISLGLLLQEAPQARQQQGQDAPSSPSGEDSAEDVLEQELDAVYEQLEPLLNC